MIYKQLLRILCLALNLQKVLSTLPLVPYIPQGKDAIRHMEEREAKKRAKAERKADRRRFREFEKQKLKPKVNLEGNKLLSIENSRKENETTPMLTEAELSRSLPQSNMSELYPSIFDQSSDLSIEDSLSYNKDYNPNISKR